MTALPGRLKLRIPSRENAARSAPPDGVRLHPSDDARYELLGTIGSGVTGDVHAASDAAPGSRHVALKFLKPELSDPETVRAFRIDIERVRAFRHPNLAQTHGFGFHAEKRLHFATTEFLAADSFASLLEKRTPLAPGLLYPLLVDGLRALEFLDARRAWHGRVTPENLFVVDGRLKLADLGFRAVRTKARALRGISAYDAPETARTAGDARADLYGLGLCFLEQALGKRVQSPDGTIEPELVADGHLKAVLAKLVDPDPDCRYERPAEAIADLCARSGATYPLESEETRNAYFLGAGIVSREEELQTLKYTLNSTEIRATAVVGAPGVGKDVLLSEFKSHCREAGIEVFETDCFRSSKNPFPVFAGLLRECLDRAPAELVESLGPELKKLAPDHPALASIAANPTYDPRSERYILAKSIAEFTVDTLLDSERASILVVNDTQWIDEDSLQALGLAMDTVKKREFSRWNRWDLYLVGRPESQDAIGRLGEHGALRRLALAPFDEARTGALYEAVFGFDRVGRRLGGSVAFVRSLAKGNPFFIVEILRNLLVTGTIARDVRGWELVGEIDPKTMPPVIEELLDHRLADLEYHQVLRSGYVDEKPAYSMAHDLMRQLVVERMGNRREKAASLAAKLEALHASDRDRHLDELFGLYVLAGNRPKLVADGQRLTELLFDRGEIKTCLSRSEIVLDAIGRETDEALPILAKQAFLRVYSLSVPDVVGLIDGLLKRARKCGDRGTEYWIYRAWADSGLSGETRAKTMRNIDKAIRGYRKLGDDRELATTCNMKGNFCVMIEEYDQALACFARALELARKNGDELTESFCLGNMARVELIRGNCGAALEGAFKTLAVTEKHNNKSNTAIAYRFIAETYRKLGDDASSRRYFDLALDICAAFDLIPQHHRILIMRMGYAIEDGDAKTAERYMAELKPAMTSLEHWNEMHFLFSLQAARLEAMNGNGGTAALLLRDLLDKQVDAVPKARVHEELYRLLGTPSSYRFATRVYRARFARTKAAEYRERIASLEALRRTRREGGSGTA